MRVLYCILDNRFGGPHRRALASAHRLRDRGVETLFLLGRKAGASWQPEGFESFLCRHIQAFTRRHPLLNLIRFCVFMPYNWLKIRRIIKSRGIDVVHVDGATNFLPALVAAATRTPIVWLYNDHLLGPLRRVLLLLLTALAAKVIVQGESLRASRTGGSARLRNKTVVLRSAVDTAALTPSLYGPARRRSIREELGIPDDCTLIGTVGNLNRFKGHPYFLEAAARIRGHMDRVRFLIVGRQLETDKAYGEHLQQMTARLGLQENVVFAGFRNDIPSVLAAMDVFVLPSILESCPMALLEAMAMQVPVVATDVGAVREIVDHGRTGFVVPPRDPEAIAEAVLAILAKSPEQVREMVGQARKTVEERFAVDTIAEQQLQVYEHVRQPRVGHI